MVENQIKLDLFSGYLIGFCNKRRTTIKFLSWDRNGYSLNRWNQLKVYLNHGFVTMDNNLAENAICPFVLGRKNWLFCNTVPGAIANARLYSLIETGKANNLNPFQYLKALFKDLPYTESEDQLRNLLPQYIKTITLKLENK